MQDLIQASSPNFGARRRDLTPAFVVLHYTAMESVEAALARLCDPSSEVSAHYLIGRNGQVWQLVDEAQRAWHAGAGAWRGFDDINSRSIGIELDNRGIEPFSDPMMTSLEHLLQAVMTRWAIPPEGVIAHSDLAPGRKLDPGPRFDWRRLARQGLAIETPAGSEDPGGALEPLLSAAGYTAKASETDRLAAFRLRHRPTATGPADATDRAILRHLA